MAHNLELPAGVFDPVPDPVTLARNLVTVGVCIATSVVVMSGSYVQYAFCGALAVIFLFGLGMICVGWLVADDPARYAALGRIVTQASHVVIVFAILLHEVASASTTPANTAGK